MSDQLAVSELGSADAGAPVVLAVHGITSNSLAWQRVAALLPDHRILAPDLRGRGRSRDLPGPWGLRTHAADLARTLDAAGASRVTVAGHSMGGFVAVVLAAERPDLVERLVLVDGGLPLALPPGASPDDLVTQLGPAAARLSMEFASPEAYLDLWRSHPALADSIDDTFERYARYDLVGVAPHLRPAARAEAMLADGAELYGPDWYLDALAAVGDSGVPITALRAPRGLLDGDPLYAPSAMEAFADVLPQLSVVEVDDVNHYTIVMAPQGAAVVAPHLR